MIDEHRLPELTRRVIDASREAALATETRAALVGGGVRDLILGMEIKDLDFVAEGNVDAFVEATAERLGTGVHRHERFGTYRLMVAGLDPVDIVTARTETYAHPGALPSVAPGTIEQDLARRDFPVNCIAWDLRSGELIDPLNGLNDLRSRTLRVIHDQSFEDDPTRLLRLFRLAARLAFDIEAHTLHLARRAVDNRVLDRVSNERLRHELELAIHERDVGVVLARFAGEGLLRSLFGPQTFVVDPAAIDVAARRASERGAARHVVVMAAVLGATACAAAAEYWGPGVAHSICRTATEAASARRMVERTKDRCRLIAWSSRISIEGLVLSGHESLLDLRSAWDGARVPGETVAAIPIAGRSRGIALRKARLALASGLAAPAEAVRIAREKALKYLEDA